MDKMIYEIDVLNGEKAVVTDDLYWGRKNMVNSVPKDRQMDSDVTILVQAYNRVEKTKECINSILRYTKDVNYDLLLIDNGSTDDTFEYFKSIDYEKVRIIHLNKNISSSYPIYFYDLLWVSKYFVCLGNDIIVTSNWLKNLITIAESDDKIGMVNPVSSNVSNFQSIDFSFNSIKEMQEKAEKYNISDPTKWHERIRLITIGTLYKKECLYAIGWPINDIGFFHDFIDDDITFRIRRAGYKAILAKDTWVHHNHDVWNLENKDIKEFQKSLEIGRQNFRDKYFGIDAWDDVNVFINEIIPSIVEPSDSNNCSILGIDVKCGTPILEIKNHLRSMSIFNPECCAVTSEGKYYIDLQTVCGADNVVSCTIDNTIRYFSRESFDYIIIGNCINEYPETYELINMLYSLLKKGGQLFIYLKNTNDIFSFLNIIGYRDVRCNSYAYSITVELFMKDLKNIGISPELIGTIPYNNIPSEYINEVNKRINMFVEKDWEETRLRLITDRFVFSIIK